MERNKKEIENFYYHASKNCSSCKHNKVRTGQFPFYCKIHIKETGMLVTCSEWEEKNE